MTISLSRTDVGRCDKIQRLIHKIENRLLFFTEQIDYRQKSPYYDYYVDVLERFKSQCDEWLFCLNSVANKYNYNKTVGKGIQLAAEEVDKVYLPIYRAVDNWGERYAHCKELFKGISFPEKWASDGSKYSWFLNTLKESQQQNSVKRLSDRLYLQFIESHANNWAMVFGTLTVDPEHYKDVFGPGCKVWSEWIRNVKRKVASQISSIRQAEKEDYFHYLAVVEEGGRNGRLHIHCVLFMKEALPCRDPNYGLKEPILREISEYSRMWDYGFAQFIPIRFGASDYWGQRGWRWPEITGKPIDRTEINKITHYLVKYIMKSKQTKGMTTWRTRTDNKMGKTRMNLAIERTDPMDLLQLAILKKTPTPLKINGQKIKWELVRTQILNKIFKHRLTRREIQTLPRNTLLKRLLTSTTNTTQDSSLKSAGPLLIQCLKSMDTSDSSIEPYKRFKNRIQEIYQ